MSALTAWLAKAPQDPRQRRLLAAGFADALGTGLFLPLSVIYLTRIVGLSPARAGLGLTIAGFLAIAASPLSGALLARFDARRVVLGCFAASASGFLAYIAVGSFASFLGVAIVVQFASRMERPATAVLTLGVTPRPGQVDALARQQSLRNLGYGLGGLLAALALLVHGKTPFVVLLAANAASYVVAGLLVLQLPAVRPPERRDGDAAGYREVLRDRAYVGLALLNVIMALHDSLLLVAMPLWIITRTKAQAPSQAAVLPHARPPAASRPRQPHRSRRCRLQIAGFVPQIELTKPDLRILNPGSRRKARRDHLSRHPGRPGGTGLVRCETAARRAPEARHTTRKPGAVRFLAGGDGAAVTCPPSPIPATTAPAWASSSPSSSHPPAGNSTSNTRTRNAIQRSPRCLGERGFALLTGRWRTLQHISASPRKIGRHRPRRTFGY